MAAAGWLFWEMETAYLLCWLLGVAGFWLRNRVQPACRLVAVAGAFVLLAGTLSYQVDFGILAPLPGVWLPSQDPAQVINGAISSSAPAATTTCAG